MATNDRTGEPVQIEYFQQMHGGTFTAELRDVSYWNRSNGPNLEDRYSMFFTRNGAKHDLGSHSALDGVKAFANNRAEGLTAPGRPQPYSHVLKG